MIKLKTLLMEANLKELGPKDFKGGQVQKMKFDKDYAGVGKDKLSDKEKEKAKKLGLVWKGKGYGKEGDDGITHKNVDGKLVKIDKDGGKEEPKSKGLSGSDFDRELPSDDDGMEPDDLSDFDPTHDEPKKEVDSEDLDTKDFEAAKQTFDKIKDIDMDAFEDGPEGYDQMMDALESLKGTQLDNYKPLQNAIDDLETNQEQDDAELVRYTLSSLKDKKDPYSGKYLGEENIKLKDIMRESKVSYLVEALQSKLLRKFTNRQDFKLDNDFYGWLAKLGIRADKVTDDMIEKTAKLSGKGVVIAVTGKKVSLPAKGKSYWRSDLEVDKGVVLSVFKDGKAVWWTKSYRESEKNRKKDIRVADTKGYGFSTSENRTFGLNQFGYQNAASVKKINGVEFYKISLEENMPYMGGKEVRKLRSDIQVGSWKWRDDESFKRQNRDKYEDAIKAMYDDPEKVKAKVKKAKDYTDGLITGLIGGKPNAAAKKLLKGLSNTRAPEMQAMELMKDITDAMDRLYDKVTYYNNAVKDDIDYEKRNPEHPKSYRNSPRYGKEVSHIVNLILKNKFRGYY